MNQDTKIVFIHRGYRWYLPYALYQANFASPNSEVVLIGDSLNFKGIQIEPLDKIQSEKIQKFKQCYFHRSTNKESFELFCWLRWFYLLEYMYQNKVSSVLHLDSDVLLYSSIEEISNCYGHLNWECGLSIPKQDSNYFTWSASGHISYWTITALEDFCNLTIASFSEREYLEKYQKKWDWHLSQNKPGGICDMTTLYLFWEANQNRIINMAKSEQSDVFDLNMNIASNYENPQYVTESGIKKVHFVNGHPYLVPINQTEALDRAHALHFQGGAKRYIRDFYTGPSFPGKTYADTLFFLQSIKAKLP
jgi:hypothetical protein